MVSGSARTPCYGPWIGASESPDSPESDSGSSVRVPVAPPPVLQSTRTDVANAIGAAIADCSAAAVARAVAAGAAPSSVEVVEIDEAPLTYVPSNATLVRVKAIGNLATG